MIRVLGAADPRRTRRLVGLLVLLLFVVVLVAGLAHAGDGHHGSLDARDCGLCLALLHVAVALPLAALFLVARLVRAGAPHPVWLAPARSVHAARPPPARGPPVVR